MAFMQTHKASSRPAPLTGPIKTRAEARERYSAIVEDLRSVCDEIELEGFLMDMQVELIQFEAELPFLWDGDGDDFIGLSAEIERARQRVARWSAQW